MENQEQNVTVTLSRDEYRNLTLFMKSLNMVRLSQNFDTDVLSMAIAQTAQTIVNAGQDEDNEKEPVNIQMNEEMRKNLEVFLQNLNLTRLSGNTDTVTLSLAIVQVAQAVARSAQPQEVEQPVRTEKPARAAKSSKGNSNVTPIRGEIVE